MPDRPYRIVISGVFLSQPATGVQRHAWEIVRRLLRSDVCPVIAVPRDLRLSDAYSREAEPHLLRVGVGSGHLWQQTQLPGYLTKRDLLWTPAGLGTLAHRKQVVTLHDLSVLDHPEWFSRSYSGFYRLWLPPVLRRARHIFTSSAFSKGRLMERLGIPEANISVISSAVCETLRVSERPEEHQSVKTRYNLPDKFVLAVGSIEPRKNLGRLLEAMMLLQQEIPCLHIVLVGGQRAIFKNVDFARFESERLHALGFVPDEDLRAIYRAATVFAYPSVYEGFGIPPLEAMMCGTPVVTSGTTSLPEVVGDAAVLVDPEYPASIADGLRRVIQEDGLRQRLREAGRERAALFHWEASADKVGAILQQIAAHEN